MTKSTKNGKVVYNFLDKLRCNVECKFENSALWLSNDETIIFINQETANDLIKVLQEFAETGELK
jgi:hypothetical protein